MNLPFFYTEPIAASVGQVMLNEDNSKHVVQVLRMKEEEMLKLTDGKGNLYTAQISDAHKKHCSVKIIGREQKPALMNKVCIAVSPLKNTGRFEWFLEKATEIGVSEIVPIICSRTEKQHFRHERMNGILISAMLQSQQTWLPELHETIKFEKYIASLKSETGNKYVAHCDEQEKTSLKEKLSQPSTFNFQPSTILIGPEGDFTKEEISLAIENNFIPVALGKTRLRTETAALVAATLLCVH
jgi:16S rRNA (uracil1498-N3)-methyltransferase